MTELRIAMLGMGSMNGAIVEGAVSGGIPRESFIGTTRSERSRKEVAARLGIQTISEEAEEQANAKAVHGADAVFVGVLPTDVLDVCGAIRDAVPAEAVVASVAAGVTVSALESVLREEQAVVRAMPNTPFGVGRGVAGLAPGRHVSEAAMGTVATVFEAGGEVHMVEESLMDSLNAITGSGPGYLYYLAENIIAAGVNLGFDEKIASALTAQMLSGASAVLRRELAIDSGAATSLREGMWLPGGTTARAYDVFDERGVSSAIQEGVRQSAERSAEISIELAGEGSGES